MSEWEAGISILAQDKNWPDDFWRLGELLAVNFGVTLKDLIAFLERQIEDHKASKAEAQHIEDEKANTAEAPRSEEIAL